MASLEFRFNPFSIDKEDARHKDDLRHLIRHQLKGRVSPPTDLEKAVEVMLEKSEGAFVYIARALDDLDKQEQQVWSVDQLKDMLPEVSFQLLTLVRITESLKDLLTELCTLVWMVSQLTFYWIITHVWPAVFLN